MIDLDSGESDTPMADYHKIKLKMANPDFWGIDIGTSLAL